MESIFFLGLGLKAWITIVSLIGLIVVMIRSRLPLEVAFLSVVTILLVFDIVNEEEVMAGFGSEPVVVHGAFFVVLAGLMHTGVLYWLTNNLMGTPKTYRRALFKLMVPVSVLAAMLNSVNVVALFIDMVKLWAHRLGTQPSRRLPSQPGRHARKGVAPAIFLTHAWRDGNGEAVGHSVPSARTSDEVGQNVPSEGGGRSWRAISATRRARSYTIG